MAAESVLTAVASELGSLGCTDARIDWIPLEDHYTHSNMGNQRRWRWLNIDTQHFLFLNCCPVIVLLHNERFVLPEEGRRVRNVSGEIIRVFPLRNS